MDNFNSTDDARADNALRHKYKKLSDEEKSQMASLKDAGADFLDQLAALGESRELSIAKTKIEEAVMWAVKHVTR